MLAFDYYQKGLTRSFLGTLVASSQEGAEAFVKERNEAHSDSATQHSFNPATCREATDAEIEKTHAAYRRDGVARKCYLINLEEY